MWSWVAVSPRRVFPFVLAAAVGACDDVRTLIPLTRTASSPASMTYPLRARTPLVLPAEVPGTPVPRTFFGLHMLNLGVQMGWPTVDVGMFRMIAATPRWHELEPVPGATPDTPSAKGAWDRLAYVTDYAEQHRRGPLQLLFTLAGEGKYGGFPEWVRRLRTRQDTLDAWRDYVHRVGTLYRGRIRYWEVWNEINCSSWYNAGPGMLVDLTRIAHDELKAIDPENVIVGPNFAMQYVDPYLAFLDAGGAKYIDVVAWHPDPSPVPEQDTTLIRTLRARIAAHGGGNLPFWATEGHSRAGADSAAVVARAHLVFWLYGIRNWDWYAWDVTDYEEPGTTYITLTQNTMPNRPHAGNPEKPSAAGVAYGELAKWMIGTAVDSAVVDRGNWVVYTTRGVIVWATSSTPPSVDVPQGSIMRDLTGGARPWPNPTYIPTGRPVLFEQTN